MGYGCDVPDAGYGQSCCLKGAYGGLPAGSGALDQNFHLPEPLVHPLSGGLLCCPLSGEGGALS